MPDHSTDIDHVGLRSWGGYAHVMPRSHVHNEIEMNLVLEGSFSYLFGGTRREVRAGDFAIFWGSVPHQLVELHTRTAMRLVTLPLELCLQWQLPDSLMQPLLHGEVIIEQANETFSSDVEAFHRWQGDLSQNSDEHRHVALLEIEARLRRLALSYAQRIKISSAKRKRAQTAETELRKVEQITAFIARHYQHPLQIADIADAVKLHPNYAMNLFRKEFGMSLLDYLTRYRLSHAQRLLATTDLNILNVALDSGFGSASRFYTVFKQASGESPHHYRSRLRGEDE